MQKLSRLARVGGAFAIVLLASCAPTVTETETAPGAADLAPSSPAGSAGEMPVFEEGRVEHSAFVEPPIDVTALAPHTGDGPLAVVATVGQITDIVESVGGERVTVTQVVPGEDDPHLYVPTPGDVAAFAQADAIFYNGLFLEGQMGETFKHMQDFGVPTVAVTAGFEPAALLEREYSPGEFVSDPHVWFDPDLWSRAAGNVATTLTALDPDGAPAYASNLAEYQARLAALRDWGIGRLATVPERQRVLVTSHDAFGYFGRRFGVEVLGLQGLSTEAEAGTRDIERLVSFIVERQVPAVFVEASVSPEALTAVTEAVRVEGGDVRIGGELFGDTPGQRGTVEGTYPGMVLWNIATITTALEGDAGGALPPALAENPRWDYSALVDRASAEAAE